MATEGSAQQPAARSRVHGHELRDELSGKLTETSSFLFELGKYAVPLAVGLTLVHSLLLTVKQIEGPSMLPTYQSGDRTVVDRRDWVDYRRGDVVILRYPGDPEHRQYIKRIVAVPGDTYEIASGRLYVNGTLVNEPYLAVGVTTNPPVERQTLAQDTYFTLGDNRPVSNDSRFFGPVHRRYIVGRVVTTLAALGLPL